MLQLRGHQPDVIAETREAFKQHQSVIIQSPTGTGKTVMAAYIAKAAAAKGSLTYFTCHRNFLLNQTSNTFREFGIHHSFIAAGRDYAPSLPTQVCSIDTLNRRLKNVPVPDMAIIDEGHHCTAAGWSAVIGWWLANGAKIILLSATPRRLDGKGMGDIATYMVKSPPVSWFIENGYLSDFVAYAPEIPDTSGLHTLGGDFNKHENAELMDRPSITGCIIEHWKKLADGKRTLLFDVSIEASIKRVEAFNAAGVPAEHLDGKSTDAERAAAAVRLANGQTRLLSNVELFGEGYDLSAQVGSDVTIDAIISAQPTQSEARWLQQCGRVLRVKADGSKAIIIDHAGNIIRPDGTGHGLPDEERNWTLEGDPDQGKRRRNSDRGVSVRQCTKCFRVHKPAPACPACGYVYPIKARQVEEREGTLTEIDREKLQVQRKRRSEQGQAQSLDALTALGAERGYKNPAGWARHIYHARQRKTA